MAMMTERSNVSVFDSGKPGWGVSYRWGRTINGVPYSFTFVLMPDGERRHFVSRYNGYLKESIESGLSTLADVLRWGCAWSPVHEWNVRTEAGEHVCPLNLVEVRMSDCRYGCKVMACPDCKAESVWHSRTYGCPKG